ncbi:MAG: hypothetical protein ACRDZO_02795, partial [Egibacteraceae bacterium]
SCLLVSMETLTMTSPRASSHVPLRLLALALTGRTPFPRLRVEELKHQRMRLGAVDEDTIIPSASF